MFGVLRILAGALVLGTAVPAAALTGPAPAVAAAVERYVALAGPTGDADALAAECARLRAELERANAEISALKRTDRGVRDDYRLRKKMAEAEAVARRLTEAEAQLRALRGPTVPAAPPPAATPAPAPALRDVPAVLEAQADVLSDQAHRLEAQADALTRAAAQVRARQTLRRTAGRLDQDPFASLDASKRFITVRPDAKGNNIGAPGGSKTNPPPAQGDGRNSTAAPGAGLPPSSPQPPPDKGASDTTPPPDADRSLPPLPPGTGGTVTTPAPISRALLDPATLAEIRRAEAAGGRPLTELEKMERAAASLRARAQAVEAQARALRAKARP
jgi:hypothetical protein